MREGEPRPATLEGFARQYGLSPDVVVSAPGRVVVVGDHTDYQGGCALAVAVAASVEVAVRQRPDDMVRWASATTGERAQATVAALRETAARRPLQGLLGFVAAVFNLLGRDRGADIFVDSTLPVGAGLSSSAALSLALARSLAPEEGSALEWGRLAQAVENEYLGIPSGVLDQLAIIHAREGAAVHIDATENRGVPVPFDWASGDRRLWVVDTGEARRLRDVPYAERVAQAEAARAALGVRSLRYAEQEAVEQLDDPLLRRRARHIVEENRRVEAVRAAAARSAWDEVAALLRASHASLRDQYEVSTPRLDATVDCLDALDAGLGARLTGAGFGGSVVALGPARMDGPLREALATLYRDQGWPPPAVMAVPSPAAGPRRLR